MEDFTGTLAEVNAEEQVISVEVPDTAEGVEAGMLTLEFEDTTEVLKDFMAMPIDSLQANQEVRVMATKEEDRYIPSKVMILE